MRSTDSQLVCLNVGKGRDDTLLKGQLPPAGLRPNGRDPHYIVGRRKVTELSVRGQTLQGVCVVRSMKFNQSGNIAKQQHKQTCTRISVHSVNCFDTITVFSAVSVQVLDCVIISSFSHVLHIHPSIHPCPLAVLLIVCRLCADASNFFSGVTPFRRFYLPAGQATEHMPYLSSTTKIKSFRAENKCFHHWNRVA